MNVPSLNSRSLACLLLRDRSRRDVAQTNRDGPIIVRVLSNIPQLLRSREERFQQHYRINNRKEFQAFAILFASESGHDEPAFAGLKRPKKRSSREIAPLR
jgi:hypothetical protein